MTVTLDKVVTISLQRNIPASKFFLLLKELSDEPELTPLFQFSAYAKPHWPLLKSYIYETLIASDFNNTCENFNSFLHLLNSLSVDDQISCLTYLCQLSSMNKIPWLVYLPNVAFIDSLTHFLSIAKVSNDEIAWPICKIIEYILKSSHGIQLNEKLINAINDISGKVTNYNFSAELASYRQSCSSLMNDHELLPLQSPPPNDGSGSTSAVPADANTSALSTKNVAKNVGAENAKAMKLKKFIWLNQLVTVEFKQFDENKMSEFKTLLNLTNVSTTDAINFMTIELISGLFDCYEMSSTELKFIWHNYIVWTLPTILKSVFKINQVKLESCLNTIKSQDVNKWNSNSQIISEFERSLVDSDLIKSSNSVFGTLASATNSNESFSLEDLEHEFTSKLIDSNPEFISLEDSRLSELLFKIKAHIQLRNKFNSLVSQTANSFIFTNDSQRLRRLIICLCIDHDIMFSFLLSPNTSPYKFVVPLLKLLESNIKDAKNSTTSSNNSTLGATNNSQFLPSNDIIMAGTEYDQGFVDFGSSVQSISQMDNPSMCIIIIFIQFIINKFRLDLNCKEITKCNAKQTISMIQCSAWVDIKNKEDIVNKWIVSLFDVTNTEGISDSLIKSLSPVEYSVVLPEVVFNCMKCYKLEWVNDEMIDNGLEYFREIFLVGWLPNIVNELCNYKLYDDSLQPVLIKCILKLLDDQNINGEIALVIGLTKEICQKKVTKYFGDDKQIKQFYQKQDVTAVDKRYSLTENIKLLIKWLNESDVSEEHSQDVIHSFFDLPSIWESLNETKLPMDKLYQTLNSVLSISNNSTELVYELVSLLIIAYSKWQTGSVEAWVKGFIRIKESKTNGDSIEDLIYNRLRNMEGKGQWKGLKDSGPAPSKEESSKPESVVPPEDDFFGFIREPEDSDMTDVDKPKDDDAKEGSGNQTQSKKVPLADHDLYVLNMFDIFAHEGKVAERLVRKIVSLL